jgi:hypothetical protein
MVVSEGTDVLQSHVGERENFGTSSILAFYGGITM